LGREIKNMKKIMIFSIVFGIMLVTVGFVFAAKPTAFDSNGVEKGWEKNFCTTIQSGELNGSDGSLLTTGYNEWGYNYQAHMFNGMWCDYHPYYRLDGAGHDWCIANYGDVELMMKWNDAWLANNDCDGDKLLDRHYGFPTYIGSGAWLTNHERGSYLGNWDLIGDWEHIGYFGLSEYKHEWTVTSQTDGIFEGTGQYPAGGPYTISWTMTGVVDGDNVEMHITYDNGYWADLTGTIASGGTMDGEWTDSNSKSGEWETTSGAATRETCEYDYFVKIVAAPADAYAEDGIWYTADGVEIGPVIWGSFAIIQEVENDACAGIEGIQYNSPSPTGFGFYKPKLVLVDTVEVPSDGTTVKSIALAEEGIYLLKASGTYRFADWGVYGIADAEWAYRNDAYKDDPLPIHGWTLGENTYPSGCGLDVQVDGGCVDWGNYNDVHDYVLDYIGNGGTVSFHIHDSAYGDNSGFITVNIYELP
jgi:hypothetical protein